MFRFVDFLFGRTICQLKARKVMIIVFISLLWLVFTLQFIGNVTHNGVSSGEVISELFLFLGASALLSGLLVTFFRNDVRRFSVIYAITIFYTIFIQFIFAIRHFGALNIFFNGDATVSCYISFGSIFWACVLAFGVFLMLGGLFNIKLGSKMARVMCLFILFFGLLYWIFGLIIGSKYFNMNTAGLIPFWVFINPLLFSFALLLFPVSACYLQFDVINLRKRRIKKVIVYEDEEEESAPIENAAPVEIKEEPRPVNDNKDEILEEPAPEEEEEE